MPATPRADLAHCCSQCLGLPHVPTRDACTLGEPHRIVPPAALRARFAPLHFCTLALPPPTAAPRAASCPPAGAVARVPALRARHLCLLLGLGLLQKLHRGDLRALRWAPAPACRSSAGGTIGLQVAAVGGSAEQLVVRQMLLCSPAPIRPAPPAANSSLCVTCPANLTTSRDGEAACTVPLTPGTHQEPRRVANLHCLNSSALACSGTRHLRNLGPACLCACFHVVPPPAALLCALRWRRYAVVVDFYVVLTGLDLDDVVVRVSGKPSRRRAGGSAQAPHPAPQTAVWAPACCCPIIPACLSRAAPGGCAPCPLLPTRPWVSLCRRAWRTCGRRTSSPTCCAPTPPTASTSRRVGLGWPLLVELRSVVVLHGRAQTGGRGLHSHPPARGLTRPAPASACPATRPGRSVQTT